MSGVGLATQLHALHVGMAAFCVSVCVQCSLGDCPLLAIPGPAPLIAHARYPLVGEYCRGTDDHAHASGRGWLRAQRPGEWWLSCAFARCNAVVSMERLLSRQITSLPVPTGARSMRVTLYCLIVGETNFVTGIANRMCGKMLDFLSAV